MIGTSEKKVLNSVSTALTVLDHLGTIGEGGVNEIARQLDIPVSRAFRALHSLLAHGFVAQDAMTRRYRLGLKLFELGSRVVGQMGLRDAAYPEMERLFAETDETVNLAILEGGEVLYLERLQKDDVLVLNLPPGRRVPVHATALGKALLAASPAATVNEVLAGASLEGFTAKTITRVAALRRQLDTVRERGFAIDDEELVDGFRCAAAVIRGSEGVPLAGLSLSAPVRRVGAERLAELGKLVRDAADRVSARLGHAVSDPATESR